MGRAAERDWGDDCLMSLQRSASAFYVRLVFNAGLGIEDWESHRCTGRRKGGPRMAESEMTVTFLPAPFEAEPYGDAQRRQVARTKNSGRKLPRDQ
jgi:hypothetical protein